LTFWREIGFSHFLLSTMNIPDSSPSSFHDANQDPSPASATPASADTVTTPSEDTPIRQRRLFPEALHRESDDDDDNEEVEDTTRTAPHSLIEKLDQI
jgi:hypothetical protein